MAVGPPAQSSSGERLAPAQVSSGGNIPPCVSEGLVSTKPPNTPPPPPAPPTAGAPAAPPLPDRPPAPPPPGCPPPPPPPVPVTVLPPVRALPAVPESAPPVACPPEPGAPPVDAPPPVPVTPPVPGLPPEAVEPPDDWRRPPVPPLALPEELLHELVPASRKPDPTSNKSRGRRDGASGRSLEREHPFDGPVVIFVNLNGSTLGVQSREAGVRSAGGIGRLRAARSP